MAELPKGVITFLLTDVEGSTRLWEDAPDAMSVALARHDEIVDEIATANDGTSVKPRGEGDSHFLVFAEPDGAVRAAAQLQRRVAVLDAGLPRPLRVRIALHTGTADVRDSDYYGPTVNRVARLRSVAHGGQTLMSQATWELVRDTLPDGVSIRDMGEHGLKDLSRPEHVFQLDIVGLRTDFPPLVSLDAVPNNLPLQLTEFVGRERELENAKTLLGEVRLLTILAPGGVGKTRLAIQLAADAASAFPDGVFFIGLADVEDPADIDQAVAESLGLGLTADQAPRNQLLTYLSNKRKLLLFDNFDHLTKDAAIVADLLRAAPNVTILATTRTRLNLTGETLFTLAGLDTEWDDPDMAFQTSGVRLFVDAAHRANPSLVLGPDDLSAIGDIMRLTGGLPLAILLAAAWVDVLPVSEIAAEISANLDFLESGAGDIPDRHRSVRAVFDYSWRLLDDEERATFAALSVFRGGFDRQAAQQIAGASLRGLANLVNKTLVTPKPQTGRYSVHELLRQYAEGELAADAERSVRIRDAHSAYYAEVTDEATKLFFVSDQVRMLELLETDLDNVRAAFRHDLAKSEYARAKRFLFGLFMIYEVRGWYPPAMSLFGEVNVEATEEETDAAALARLAIASRAWFASLLGRPASMADQVREAFAATPQGAPLLDRWHTLQCLAITVAYMGEVEEMATRLDEGIAACAEEDDPFWRASLYNWRSFAALLGGDPDLVLQLTEKALPVLEERDNHYFMTWTLWLRALVATAQGRPQDGIDLHTRQVERAGEIGYLRGRVVALEGLGDANMGAERYAEAEWAYIEAMATAEKMGMARDMLGMMVKVARSKGSSGDSADGVALLSTVLAAPMSAEQTFTATTPIAAQAIEIMEDLRTRLDAETADAAEERGRARPFEVAAKELLERLDR